MRGQLSARTEMGSIPNWHVYMTFYVLLPNIIMDICIYNICIYTYIQTRGGADKSLARPTSHCRRMESIVSLEREVVSCAEFQVFSCYRC